MERSTIYLDAELKRQLKATARRRKTSEAALIREALNSFLAPKAQKGGLRPVGNSTDGGVGYRVDGALEELDFGER